ncbi:MAG: peptide antibiotic transporter SbmA [Granulosicoccaceae bacterium]
MFRSFFPHPKWFFLSAVAWCGLAMFVWFGLGFETWQPGLDWAAQYTPTAVEGERPPFLKPEKLWVYLYILGCGFIFPLLWIVHGRNGWYRWAVVGTTVIVVVSYFTVQVSVFMNDWYGGFYDLIQRALSEPGSIEASAYWSQLATVLPVLMVNISVLVVVSFFTKHYLFRWRTAMSNYYMHYWPRLRTVEGAAQRVQEDTQRFARIMESLGEGLIDAVMTLIAFLPLLMELSERVPALPFFGEVENSLLYVAIGSALFGTVLMALVGIKLPGLEFNNQKVEASFRKELVYGEDSAERCEPPTVSELYHALRKNYFRLYFHYLYFGVFRYGYLQFSNFLTLIALGPTIIAGTVTFGFFQQVSQAFGKVEGSLQYLANAWPTIIDLISIHKRLALFESHIANEPVPQRSDWIYDFSRK